MPGALDARGVYQYAEDDEVYPFSSFMNRGQASVSTALAADRARLDDLEATAAETFATITYATGWRAPAGTDPAASFVVRRSGLRCWLDTGSVENSTVMSIPSYELVHVFTIPAGFRPTKRVQGPASCFVPGLFMSIGQVRIQTNGQVFMQTTNAWTSVAVGGGSFSSTTCTWVVPS